MTDTYEIELDFGYPRVNWFKLSIIKVLGIKGFMALFDYLKTNNNIIVNRSKAAGSQDG